MKKYVAYTRVSTTKQGEKSASLPEQKAVIESYAKREGLSISLWYEERVTAAKVGRTVFLQMVKHLQGGKAHGLILHKIDRGARNLKDWALLSELTDSGVDVRIAGDSIDMTSRGGRLSADIQAVVAADYIRNLREEVKKGQRGRLKQGLYPWAAPYGYLDSGRGGQQKRIDPVAGPIVRRAFEAYASGKETLRSLSALLHGWGMKTRGGRPVTPSRVNEMLRHRFYVGILDVAGSSYLGSHEPLISKELFDRVQDVLDGRSAERVFGQRVYPLKRLVRCGACERFLYAETQKGRRYYRCHSQGCKGTCLSEESVLAKLVDDVSRMRLSNAFLAACGDLIEETKKDAVDSVEIRLEALRLKGHQLEAQLTRLVDAYLEQALEREEYEKRRSALLEEQIGLRAIETKVRDPVGSIEAGAEQFLELAKSLCAMAEIANLEELRELLQSSISNLFVLQKSVVITWVPALSVLLTAGAVLNGGPTSDSHRTLPFSKEEEWSRARAVIEAMLLDAGVKLPLPSSSSASPDVQLAVKRSKDRTRRHS